jgi:hypothetical protein
MFPTPVKTSKSVEELPKTEEKIVVTNKPIKTDDDKMSVVIVVPTSEPKIRALKEVSRKLKQYFFVKLKLIKNSLVRKINRNSNKNEISFT